jgi:hypothetical protein
MPVVLGGDHSITFATVRAFAEPIHIIQFDAHTDYAPITDALRFTNGHAFRHIAAMSHVTGITQIGIRSLRTSPEQLADIRRDGHRIATIEHFRTAGIEKSSLICRQGPVFRQHRRRCARHAARAGLCFGGAGWADVCGTAWRLESDLRTTGRCRL